MRLRRGVRLFPFGINTCPTFPPTIYDLLASAYDSLVEQCGDPRVAVRSSAVDEDGQNLSFAGQYETYLNLTGVQAVADAVLRCWAFARSARLEPYRRQRVQPNLENQNDVSHIALAVLVQQLVTEQFWTPQICPAEQDRYHSSLREESQAARREILRAARNGMTN